MLKKQGIFSGIARFHDDEDGIEALQVVMIVAIAAIVLIALMTVAKPVVQWMIDKAKELMGMDVPKMD